MICHRSTGIRLRSALGLAGLLACGFGSGISAAEGGGRPNIVVILVDDLRWDELGHANHPFVRTPHIDRIAEQGVQFRSAFATTPLSSPSRATLLTGLHAHSHGITDDTDRSAASHRLDTFPRRLQAVGYKTAFVGSWHMGDDDSPRPGFDRWVALRGQGASLDPALNVDGERVQAKGYATDLLTRHAIEFLKRDHDAPFLLYFSHKALGPETVRRAGSSLSDPGASRFVPAERHQDLYADEQVLRRPNAFGAPEGKPALQREIPGVPPLGPATGLSDETILSRLRMLASVDESTGEILHALEASGQLDQTVIVFTSDHGSFKGEHGLGAEAPMAYEEGIRIPLLFRYPLRAEAGGRRNQMVLTLDLAPTLLDLAGVSAGPEMQGASLVPLLEKDGPPVRDGFLIEYHSDDSFPRMERMGYQALRTEDWKYIRYVELDGMDELYDMNRDLYEMRNRASDPRWAEKLLEMKEQLARRLLETGADVR